MFMKVALDRDYEFFSHNYFSSKSRCHSLGTLGSSSFMSCTRELSSQEERRRGKGAQTLKIDLTAGQEKKGKKNGRRVSVYYKIEKVNGKEELISVKVCC